MRFSGLQIFQATVLLLSTAQAQTPPGYSPQTDSSVAIAFGNTVVSNGTFVSLNG